MPPRKSLPTEKAATASAEPTNATESSPAPPPPAPAVARATSAPSENAGPGAHPHSAQKEKVGINIEVCQPSFSNAFLRRHYQSCDSAILSSAANKENSGPQPPKINRHQVSKRTPPKRHCHCCTSPPRHPKVRHSIHKLPCLASERDRTTKRSQDDFPTRCVEGSGGSGLWGVECPVTGGAECV